MVTDTIPAAVPGPDEAPGSGATNSSRPGLLASTLAPVDPARPDFDLAPETPRDGAVEAPVQSASGGSSASYHGTDETPQNSNSNAGNSIQKQGIWRAWLLAGATRWGKGGGAVNKRLDLAKARAQAHQVKEARQVSVNRSGGLLGRNSAGSGGAGASGGKASGNKGASNGAAKGPKNSNGSAHGSAGHGPVGRSGSGGGSGSAGSGGSGGGRGYQGGGSSGGPGGGHSPKAPKGDGGGRSPKLSKGDSSKGGTSGDAGGGKAGAQGSAGSAGKNGTNGGSISGGKGSSGDSADEKAKGAQPKDNSSGKGLEKGAKGAAGAAGTQGKGGAAGKDGSSNSPSGSGKNGRTDTRTPLEKSRETGHGDGSKARRVVDHVLAYADGVKDGWGDERDKNTKEHDRLDKAHAEHKAKTQGTTQGQTVQIEDDNEPMEDPFMRQATPIQAQGIDAKKITLGEGFVKPSVTRGELRRFKDYEGRLEARIDALAKIADATKTLAAQAREQAKDCQTLAEQAKGVKGGEKLVGALQKLADQAKTQADEADEVHKRAARAHDFAKGVLSNIQTRYAPLYQAVVDSDEVKPAELKFYADRGVTPTNTTLAA